MTRSRYRSVSYDLDAVLDLCRTVEEAGAPVDASFVAAALGYSGVRNGAFLTRLANARLFGVVAGPSGAIEVTPRGRAILSGTEPAATAARVEAVRAVPLFRMVLDRLDGRPVPDLARLAELLVGGFGEDPQKAPTCAAKLLDSALQAGLIDHLHDGTSLFRASFTDFTDRSSTSGGPGVTLSRTIRMPGVGPRVPFGEPGAREGGGMDRDGAGVPGGNGGSDGSPEGVLPGGDGGLYLDGAGKRAGGGSRRWALPAAALVLLAAVGVPVGLTVAGSSAPPLHQVVKPAPAPSSGARVAVLDALSATTAAGNFAFTYQLTGTAGTSSEPPCVVPGASGPLGRPSPTTVGSGVTIPAGSASIAGGSEATTTPCRMGPSITTTTGGGIVDVSPYAMAASASIETGLNVDVEVFPSTVVENFLGNASSGPITSAASLPALPADAGTSLSGFAGLVEGTLGSRDGALAMLGMATPTGFLDLDESEMTGATGLGTATVGGQSVTQYRVVLDPSRLVSTPGLTSDEITTINAAVSVLKGQGYSGTTDTISIDAAGLIVASSSVSTFADGGTATLAMQLSKFGCAGTLPVPGGSAGQDAPAGCTSPTAPHAVTSPATAPVSAPSTTAPSATVPRTTVPSATVPTSTPGSTTTNPGSPAVTG